MRITEPMTMITDYLMGALALVLAVRLLRDGVAPGQTSIRLWAVALLMTATASFVGGSYHGFIDLLPAPTAAVMWKLTLAATGIGSACLLAAAVYAGTAGTLQRVLVLLVVGKLAAYLWWIASRNDFIFVIYDYGSALVLVLLLAWFARPTGLTAASGWITAGVVVSVLAALVQARRIAPHPQFNHNDLFHVIQMGALYLLYRGGLLMRDFH